MDTRKIRKLIELVKETGIGELEVKSGDESVRISCQHPSYAINPQPMIQTTVQHPPLPAEPNALNQSKPSTAVSEQPSANQAADAGYRLRSPMVGTVYLAATPGSKPFVAPGDRVQVGDTLCLIEAMKMFNKIESDVAGVISARLIDNGQPVEYDQPLFIIDTGE